PLIPACRRNRTAERGQGRTDSSEYRPRTVDQTDAETRSEMAEKPVVDAWDAVHQQCQVAVPVAEFALGGGDMVGQPPAMLLGHEAVVLPVPDLDRGLDRGELESPIR